MLGNHDLLRDHNSVNNMYLWSYVNNIISLYILLVFILMRIYLVIDWYTRKRTYKHEKDKKFLSDPQQRTRLRQRRILRSELV